MKTETVTDVTPVMGADVIAGDRLWTENGFTAEITHFDAPPPGSFAAVYYGDGVRVPFHGGQPIKLPLAPGDPVDIKRRAV